MLKTNIAFLGMTHLGLVTSICSATKTENILCIDTSIQLIENLKKGLFPIEEPKLRLTYKKYKKNITFSSDLYDVKKCNIVYISVDIATDDKGNSNLEEIEKYLNSLSKIVSKDTVVVILSQVPPGFTRKYIQKFNNLFYQVETLVFGEAINRSLYPERFIVGCSDKKNVPKKYHDYLKSYNCPIFFMRYESAELTKISINLFLSSSVTLTNFLSEICELIDADFNEISPTLRLDKRIGKFAYLSPGLGISGGNLERDLMSISKLAKSLKISSKLVETWIHGSKNRKNWTFNVLSNYYKSNLNKVRKKILLCGLSYKPNTHSIKNSPSILFLNKIKKFMNFDINIYDPLIQNLPSTYKNITFIDDLCVKDFDILIIMNTSDDFKKINNQNLMGIELVIDPFRVIENNKIKTNKYFTLGS